jgi:uncharacterized protein
MPLTRRSAIRRNVLLASAALLAALGGGVVMRSRVAKASAPRSYRQIRWPDLVPAEWDQYKRMREFRVDRLRDADPRAQQLLADMRAAWDAAPLVASLDGAQVQIAGFVVPLEVDPRGLTEMLLVPYEGACIHTPPPPANQIIHVILEAAVKGLRLMDNVQVQGVIEARRETTFRAVAGYAITSASVHKRQPA